MNNIFLPFIFYFRLLKTLFSKGTRKELLLFWLYLFTTIGLFFYSFTQIDLGLVITRIPWLYGFEKNFQYIGYFNRPLSALLFSVLIIIFFFFYIYIWRLSTQKKISSFAVWSIIGVLAFVLTFSYNAFSYDLFNYIFDAKIVTYYHQNPYQHKALDYPRDPMLGFMHWTHRTYPYGPAWLALTLPLSFLGSHIFILTFFLFKMLMTASYLGTSYFLYKILQKLYPEKAIEGTILFSLNPLVIVESLVSAHNDIVMFYFLVWAIYLFLIKRYRWAWTIFIISVSVKFATIVLLPIFIYIFLANKKMSVVSWRFGVHIMFCLMLFSLTLVTSRTAFQPWYLLYILCLFPFLQSRMLQAVIIFLTFVVQGTYLPYLFSGVWDNTLYGSQELIYYYLTFFASFIAGIYIISTCYRLLRKR